MRTCQALHLLDSLSSLFSNNHLNNELVSFKAHSYKTQTVIMHLLSRVYKYISVLPFSLFLIESAKDLDSVGTSSGLY